MSARAFRAAARAALAATSWAALWAAPGCGGEEPRLELGSGVERCRQQLRRIYAGLKDYERLKGHAPAQGGVRFFAALIAEGVWTGTADNAACLSCPGVRDEELGLAGASAAERFGDLARVTGASSAYAGRDLARWPLASVEGPGSEPLIACDNHLGPNHGNLTNVLCADGSVVTLELDRLQQQGLLPPHADRVPIGPDAPPGILRGALVKFSQH
jgi:hypothetical protein